MTTKTVAARPREDLRTDTNNAEDQQIDMAQESRRSIRTNAAVLGFIVGGLMQGSNLGGTCIIILSWVNTFSGIIGQDDDYLEDASTLILVTGVCAWSAMTAVMGVAVLFFLRIMVTSILIGLDHCNKRPEESRMQDVHLQILHTFDRYFFMGGMMGTAGWWLLTFQTIGCMYVVYQNGCIFIAALVFYVTTKGEDWTNLGVQEAGSNEESHNGIV